MTSKKSSFPSEESNSVRFCFELYISQNIYIEGTLTSMIKYGGSLKHKSIDFFCYETFTGRTEFIPNTQELCEKTADFLNVLLFVFY